MREQGLPGGSCRLLHHGWQLHWCRDRARPRSSHGLSEAGPVVWNNDLRTVAGAAHGRSLARIGELDAEIAAAGDGHDSTQFPSYGPGASTAARFKDSAVVISDLPAGTPVTLTFRVVAWSLAIATGNGVASSSCQFTVIGSTKTAYWSFSSARNDCTKLGRARRASG
ncbi:hypothetical protein [Sorangium sp. So ce590]|uniref:hypothetical protein n=1 Tax=unclassified Sorangium TaxID=2621164 RepID=UPI003F646D4D